MNRQPSNPFSVTKAVDFSNDEIQTTWVDYPTGGGYISKISPTDPMPKFLLGGKGSGRTHLMRYYSFSLQLMRHGDLQSLLGQGYLGIYLRCSGLNAGRFSGKGQVIDVWNDLFAYAFDLMLAQELLSVLGALTKARGHDSESELHFVRGALSAIDDLNAASLQVLDIAGLRMLLKGWQREVDVVINNAAFTKHIQVPIRLSRGRILWEWPRVAEDIWPDLKGVRFLYIIDELENLTEQQQRYVNTLVRERENPAGFLVGSRTSGFRTRATLSADETNVEGSEFETLTLDQWLNSDPEAFKIFVRGVVGNRLRIGRAGVSVDDLDQAFAEPRLEDSLGVGEGGHHLSKLSLQLENLGGYVPDGPLSSKSLEFIIECIRFDDDVLVQKTNCFLLYREWSAGRSLVHGAARIRKDATLYASGDSSVTLHSSVLRHFRGDLMAQLYRELGRPQYYGGLNSISAMGDGLIRNVLVILKNIWGWSDYLGEDILRKEGISVRAQQDGIIDAARWYMRDAPTSNPEANNVVAAIGRLGDLFRRLRFSDKPAESSLNTFSVDLYRVSAHSRDTIELAESWGLLNRVNRGQRAKNTGHLLEKFRLKPMLCPLWDLPIGSRGAIELTPFEANAIFDFHRSGEFDIVASTREKRQNAPFGRRPAYHSIGQLALLEEDEHREEDSSD